MSNKVKVSLVKNNTHIKVLDISGEPGNVLENHKVDINALLLMCSGSIIYKEGDKLVPLSSGDSHDIPANTLHQLRCTTTAKFFVIMSDKAKMKFEV